jgi:RNA polymerase sigma-70 factor (ECF subfamily)
VSEHELIKGIALNDHAAFKALVELYQSRILNTCHRILGNQQDAEDVAQEVFVKVFEKAGSFRSESAVSTWLYRIAVNLSLNYRRRQKWSRYLDVLTLSETAEEDPVARIEAPEKDRPDRLFEEKERGRILGDALNTLPERQRAAFVLHKFEGLSYEEISEVLESSISSIESLIHRAKRNLQKRLVRSLGGA